jgi:CHAD domain-containing protein
MSDDKHPSDGKWVEGLTAATPVGAAARRVLAARLGAVNDALSAAAAWGADPEPVHKLRVATRRAGAALNAFADLLPGKAYRKARRVLKRLRRSAGAARDADVFLDALRLWSIHQSPAARPGAHFLLGHVFAHRQAAQAGLGKAIEQARAKPLTDLAAKVRGGSRESLRERAVPVLADLLRELETAAAGNLDDYGHLHGVRIQGKRLRYALEVFINCFDPAAREQVYPLVEGLQDILGLANDSYQAGSRLDALADAVRTTQPGLWELVRVGVEDLRAYHRQRIKEQRAAFADWWLKWRSLRPESVLGPATATASSAAGAPAGTPPAGEPAARP